MKLVEFSVSLSGVIYRLFPPTVLICTISCSADKLIEAGNLLAPPPNSSRSRAVVPFSSSSLMSVPPYLHFTQIGDPVLRQVAEEVPAERIGTVEIDQIVERMVKVLRHYDCVGVAAPQVGIPLRIIVMEFREGKQEQFKPEIYAARKMSTLPLAVFINPELEITSSALNKHPEGCMSVRGYSAEVERYDKVRIRGIGKLGTSAELELEGWNARIAQHEMDHLNGMIYVDRMDVSTFNCLSWQQINAAEGRSAIWFHK